MDAQASTTWAYDDVGNITSITSGHADPFLNATSAFGERGAGPDQLTTITFPSGNEMFSYDAAGRMTQDGTRTLTYDAKGRLARVVRGTTTEEYVYGFDDERAIKRTTQGGSTDEVRYIDRDVALFAQEDVTNDCPLGCTHPHAHHVGIDHWHAHADRPRCNRSSTARGALQTSPLALRAARPSVLSRLVRRAREPNAHEHGHHRMAR
jgi:hypothetical protein